MLAVCLVLATAGAGVLLGQGIAVSHMDRKVAPGDDFFAYANGRWVAHTRIPADRGSINVFSELTARTLQRTRRLIEAVIQQQPAAGTASYQVETYYQAFLDEKEMERDGMAPLAARLKQITAIETRRDLARVLGESLRADVDPLNDTNYHTPNLFGLWVAPGFHDPAHYTAYLLQGGLELPSRQYYLDSGASMQTLRAAYEKHIAAMLRLEGYANPGASAAAVYGLEHAIAAAQLSLSESEDVHKADNLWTAASFEAKAPGLDWGAFFQAAGLSGVKQFDVWQPAALVGEAKLAGSEPLASWKAWLAYHLIEDNAAVLPRAVRAEAFHFFGQVVAGAEKQPPRWQDGIDAVNDALGDAVGRLYVARYFPASAKAELQTMVANLLQVYRRRLAGASWMAPSTRAEAEEKLARLYVGIGYPEQWRSYAGLQVSPRDAFGNLQRAELFQYQYEIGKLGTGPGASAETARTVNRHTWHMEPQTVNAVNLPLQDAIDFPAAILQPPFFDPQSPPAVNYGAIGAIIGHEISHTFDTTGSAFDADGRLRNWWTPADFAHFNAVAKRLTSQVSSYCPLPGLCVSGEQTIDEDMADVAGLAAAYAAYHAAVDASGKLAPAEHGFSPDQQFFIAYAQNYATHIRPQALRKQVLTDSHAPGTYRADAVRNEEAWYTAFAVGPGAKLYLKPEDRVQIW